MALIPHDWKDGTIQRQNQPGLIRDNDVEEYVARILSSNRDNCPSLDLPEHGYTIQSRVGYKESFALIKSIKCGLIIDEVFSFYRNQL